MNTFGIKVVREDEYKIEVDPAVWDDKARKDFATIFWPLPELEDVAKSVAQAISQNLVGSFYEGFGHVITFRNGIELTQTKIVNGRIHKREHRDFCEGIVVHIINHDFNYSVELLSEEPCQK